MRLLRSGDDVSPVQQLGFAAVCLLLEWLSYVHPMRGTHITPWSPAAALCVAMIARSPRSWWLIVAVLAGVPVLRGGTSMAMPVVAASVSRVAGYAVAALILRATVGPALTIRSRPAYFAFLGAAVVGATINALCYVGALALAGAAPEGRAWDAISRQWIGDGLSLTVGLPLACVAFDRGRWEQTLRMLHLAEWWVIVLLALSAGCAIFGLPIEEQFKFFYPLFLPVALCAARFGLTGAIWCVTLVQAMVVAGMLVSAHPTLSVFQFDMLMAALSVTGQLLGVTTDEREEAEQNLRASLRKAAEADMAAALAHELNQPLSAMRSYARALQMLAAQSAAQAQPDRQAIVEASGKLVGEADRAADVVRRLRDFFRHKGTRLAEARVESLIEAALASQAQRASSARVSLAFHAMQPLPAVLADAVQIEIVVRNLVANAIDAAAGGAGKGEAGVQVSARWDRGNVLVEVSDTGPGMAEADLSGIFEHGQSEKPGGMGIGLRLSRSIVEAHEGRLWAERGPGGRFAFTLPAAPEVEHG